MTTQQQVVTHICLLDETPISVLTPLVDQAIPSHQVIFAVKPCQQDDVSRLKILLLPRKITVSTWVLPDTKNTESIIDSFQELIEEQRTLNQAHQLVLNVSCGSRHYALAAYEVARAYGLHCFVVEPKLDELYWLYPEEKPNTQLAEKLKIKDYLIALDCNIGEVNNNGVVAKSIRALGDKWLSQLNFYDNAFSTLNYLASTADNLQLISKQLNRQQLDDYPLNDLIDDLSAINFAHLDNNKIIFSNESARFFANGGWLEEYVYSVILSLKSQVDTLQDCAQGVEVLRNTNQKSVKNEIDVMALANNKLHLIECKTKKFDKGEGNQVIYKLDSLAELLGGLHARAMLISFKEIRPSEYNRSNELDVKIIGPSQLPNLKTHLINWLNNA